MIQLRSQNEEVIRKYWPFFLSSVLAYKGTHICATVGDKVMDDLSLDISCVLSLSKSVSVQLVWVRFFAGTGPAPAIPVGLGRISWHKFFDFSVSCRTCALSSFRWRCRSPTNNCTRFSSLSRAATVGAPMILSSEDGRWFHCSFWRKTTSSASRRAFAETVSSSFYKSTGQRPAR